VHGEERECGGCDVELDEGVEEEVRGNRASEDRDYSPDGPG
jgi:ferredoxin